MKPSWPAAVQTGVSWCGTCPRLEMSRCVPAACSHFSPALQVSWTSERPPRVAPLAMEGCIVSFAVMYTSVSHAKLLITVSLLVSDVCHAP